MKIITGPTILATALSTIAQAAPKSIGFTGIQDQEAFTSECPTWFISYTIVDDSENKERNGYFEVDGCLWNPTTVGDGTYVLDLDLKAGTAVLTENSSGLKLQGSVKGDDWQPDGCDRTDTCPKYVFQKCISGGAPIGNEHPPACAQIFPKHQ